MPHVTQILAQKRHPNRRNIYLDGVFAFGCNVAVVARFRLHSGQRLTADQVEQIRNGQVWQECLDAALKLLESRLHSQAELTRKLMRKQWGKAVIAAVLDDLRRMGYVDDARFAQGRAAWLASASHHGRGRAMTELLRNGVARDVAAAAVESAYRDTDSLAMARQLARKQQSRLRRLDPAVARRRLAAMLQRRGFDYDSIKPVLDEVLGAAAEEA